ncbi:MAG: MASE3 domain-containing protein, partial [Anaerolineales bacterium]|nr:MASE3 domain-containing protein [Anaerolineales bacterium]
MRLSSVRSASGNFFYTLLGVTLILFGLYLTSVYNYLLFHSLSELSSIAIAVGVFLLVWYARRYMQNDDMLFVGIASLFISGLDMLHLLAYRGMEIFQGYGSNLPTQLWIAARYLQSLPLLVAPLFFHQKLNPKTIFAGFTAIVASILASIFYWKIFPTCYIEGAGLTSFKIISEYIISLILLASIALLYKNRKVFSPDVFQLLVFSSAALICAELAFTSYIGVYDIANLIGHIFKIISSFLFARAIIIVGLTQPYNLLFRDLKKNRDELQTARNELELRVEARTIELQELNARLQIELAERETAERLLREKDENLRLMIDGMQDHAIIMLDPQGFVLNWNSGAQKLKGYQAEEIIGKHFSLFYTPEDIQRGVPQELLKTANEQGDAKDESWRVRKDGARFLADVTIEALRNQDGSLRGYAKITRDITERKRLEDIAKRLSRQHELVLASAGEGIYGLDMNGNMTFINQAAANMLGNSIEELLGKSGHADHHHTRADGSPSPRAECPIYAAFHDGKTHHVDSDIFWRLDGSSFPVEYTSTPNRDENGEILGAVVVFRDITERKRAEQALQAYTSKLEQSNRDLQEFAYVASHDLQEPLRKVMAFGDRLATKYGETLDETGRDYIKRMRGASQRMQILINDLLSFSRVSTRAQPFVEVDLNMVAREVVSDLENLIERTGARVEVGELPVIEADSTQMRQLLQNLIGNALKFQREGQTPHVKVSAKNNGNTCQISVEDNGIGFDTQYLDRIFKPFQRLHSREEYEGSGMGLAICRRIAERHSGSIIAESAPDKGATFLVT